MLTAIHQRFQFSTRTKAKKVFDNKVAEKVKEHAQKTSIPTRYHDKYFREDAYAQIRFDKAWQNRIISRESEIWEKWQKRILYHENQWFTHVFKRTDPGQVASTPETYGNYVYFANQK